MDMIFVDYFLQPLMTILLIGYVFYRLVIVRTKRRALEEVLTRTYDVPTEEHAQELLEKLNMRPTVRAAIFTQKNRNMFVLCRNVFNDRIATSSEICTETKKKVYGALRKCAVDGLNEIA